MFIYIYYPLQGYVASEAPFRAMVDMSTSARNTSSALPYRELAESAPNLFSQGGGGGEGGEAIFKDLPKSPLDMDRNNHQYVLVGGKS